MFGLGKFTSTEVVLTVPNGCLDGWFDVVYVSSYDCAPTGAVQLNVPEYVSVPLDGLNTKLVGAEIVGIKLLENALADP